MLTVYNSNISVKMRLCSTKQPQSHSKLPPLPRNSLLNHTAKTSTNSHTISRDAPNSSTHNHLAAASKASTNDSILIQDKENYQILNKEETNQRGNVRMCCNHIQQRAEFMVRFEGGEELTYCNKCASYLVNQGFQVDRLVDYKDVQENRSQSTTRRLELNKIEQEFQELLAEVLFKKTETNFSIIACQSYYNNQIEHITECFQELHAFLEQLKNTFYNSVLSQKQGALQKRGEWSEILEELVKELDSVKQDILVSQEEVIRLSQREYIELTKSLEQHLIQYGKVSNSWQLQDVKSNPLTIPDIDQAVESIKSLLWMPVPKTPRGSISYRPGKAQPLNFLTEIAQKQLSARNNLHLLNHGQHD